MTFRLRPEAKFSDGTPVTTDDVVFSLQTLRDKGLPRFKTYYSKVKKSTRRTSVRFVITQDGGDRELPLLLGFMPIFRSTFGKTASSTQHPSTR